VEDKKFDRFLQLTRGWTLDNVRMTEVREALVDLLMTEFRNLSRKRFKVRWMDDNERASAQIAEVEGSVYLWINSDNWKVPGFAEKGLTALLRHELLHIETGLGDDNPGFRREARSRGIQTWSIDAGDIVPM
jgi:hypothetical protein